MSRIFRTVFLAAMVAIIVSGCTGSDSRQLAEQSTADVLVPFADTFRKTWEFHVEDSPGNYTFRSNWSPEFDPDVDRTKVVIGYQINDASAWTGGAETGTGQEEKDATIAAVADSADPAGATACVDRDAALQLVYCEYEVGNPEGPLTILVRRFDSTPTVMMVIFAQDAATEYLSGDFESVAIEEATAEWLTDK